MAAAALLTELARRWRRFARASEGVSAVEFAAILPFMLALYLGGAELGDGFSIQFKATLAARTLADLASQYSSIDASTMSQILGAPSVVMTPYSAASMMARVSEIEVAANATQGTVQWSCALNGSAYAQNAPIALPAKMQAPNSPEYLILGEVSYPYTPPVGYVLTGTINIYQSTFFFPRMSPSVADNNAC